MKSAALRRYAPLLVVLAVQAAFVVLLPSTARDVQTATAGESNFDSPFADPALGGGSTDSGTGDGSSTDGGTSADGSGAGVSGSGSGSGGGTNGSGTGGAVSGGGTASGDTSHCVGGRQFDPAIDYFAPPCVAAFTGSNPGATYLGVSSDKVTIVNYIEQSNAAVEASLRAQGLYVSPAQQDELNKAVEDFVNARYELYGRKIDIVNVQGNCSTIPPDNACLRQEMRQIAADHKPFAFVWVSPLTNAPFDEMSSLGVVNLGGLMFMDSFSEARRPYHWDVHMSGTEIARHTGEWWCKQMAGEKATQSAAATPAGSTNGRTRVLGVIGTNDPENIKMREELDRVLRSCGDRVAHTYDASNDLSTAATQRSASVASMRQDPESTTVLCLCNPVGAQFVYSEMQTQNYYPEIIYAGTVFTDHDDTGQANMESAGCPTGTGCTFAAAFGLSSSEPREPVGKDRIARVWTATGRPGTPPFAAAELQWDYWNLLASLIQGAGPALTPTNMEAGAFAAGFRGGGDSGHVRRGFQPGIHSWNRDMAISYWNPTGTSTFNGATGTFVRLGRFELGKYGDSLPSIPTNRR